MSWKAWMDSFPNCNHTQKQMSSFAALALALASSLATLANGAATDTHDLVLRFSGAQDCATSYTAYVNGEVRVAGKVGVDKTGTDLIDKKTITVTGDGPWVLAIQANASGTYGSVYAHVSIDGTQVALTGTANSAFVITDKPQTTDEWTKAGYKTSGWSDKTAVCKDERKWVELADAWIDQVTPLYDLPGAMWFPNCKIDAVAPNMETNYLRAIVSLPVPEATVTSAASTTEPTVAKTTTVAISSKPQSTKAASPRQPPSQPLPRPRLLRSAASHRPPRLRLLRQPPSQPLPRPRLLPSAASHRPPRLRLPLLPRQHRCPNTVKRRQLRPSHHCKARQCRAHQRQRPQHRQHRHRATQQRSSLHRRLYRRRATRAAAERHTTKATKTAWAV
ncbi:hypothetical protein BC831DRAFT_66419 [Entophlyctis helioformis]|nr:hypothetical protein BC831DRAFT_66419 [Entophlyctis helioformis]